MSDFVGWRTFVPVLVLLGLLHVLPGELPFGVAFCLGLCAWMVGVVWHNWSAPWR